MKRYVSSFFLIQIFVSSFLEAKNVGLLVMATGKYNVFIPQLRDSARKYFLPHDKVTFFIFAQNYVPEADDTVVIYQKKFGWPLDTLLRMPIYYLNREAYKEQDYLFACDADMLFSGEVSSEILSKRVATLHCGFSEKSLDDVEMHIQWLEEKFGDTQSDIFEQEKAHYQLLLNNYHAYLERNYFFYDTATNWYVKKGSYECNPHSTAYLSLEKAKYYFAGGFWGGEKDEFLQICKTITNNILTDLEAHYIAVWHDESHLNYYFYDNPPTKILPPLFCYPENEYKPYQKKLIALDKDHNEMRFDSPEEMRRSNFLSFDYEYLIDLLTYIVRK